MFLGIAAADVDMRMHIKITSFSYESNFDFSLILKRAGPLTDILHFDLLN